MKRFVMLGTICTLAACGPTEEQIRSDERAKVLEERVAELEAERDSEEAPEPVKKEATEPQTNDSTLTSAALTATYYAYIGEPDLYNNDGKRLTEPWQVLRQDRANFHRFGVSHSGDQSDPFFTLGSNRAIMERMVANGRIEASAGRRIVQGDVGVRVEIYGNGTSGQRIDVTVR
ncbi:MAG: hypothetical protein AAF692_12600 [Pseudomonadota bacterium]